MMAVYKRTLVQKGTVEIFGIQNGAQTWQVKSSRGKQRGTCLTSFCNWLAEHELGGIVRRQIFLRGPIDRKLWRAMTSLKEHGEKKMLVFCQLSFLFSNYYYTLRLIDYLPFDGQSVQTRVYSDIIFWKTRFRQDISQDTWVDSFL